VVLVVSVSLLVVLSALAIRFPTAGTPSPGGPGTRPAGFTYDQAATRASEQANNTSGGPWRLVSAEGVASTGPFTPIPSGVPINGCQTLPGPSVWNASGIPTSTDSPASGFTPFWSLLFVNPLGDILPITTVNDSLNLDPVVIPSSPCGITLSALDSGQPLLKASTINPAFDSSTAAAIAWYAAGRSFYQTSPHAIAYYSYGPSPISEVTWSDNWAISYFRCGLTDMVGTQNFSFVGVVNSTGPPEIVETGTGPCAYPGGYNMTMSQTGISPAPGGEFISLQINASLRDYLLSPSDTWGLSTWLTSLGVTNASGNAQPVANHSCNGRDFAGTACSVYGGGWFAGITTQNGFWLDDFATNANGITGWFLPNVAVYTNDTIIVYLPLSIASQALTLSLTSTNAKVPIVGAQVGI